MLTKRQAITAIYMGCLAKMAHADQPSVGTYNHLWTDEPTTWTVNLDRMKQLNVNLGAETVTITAAEVFAALRSA